MPKANKQIIIDAIVKEIEKGNGRGNVLGKIGKKWEISRTTFDRYWKTANEQQKERQELASKAADAAYIKAKADAAVKSVMSAQERKEYLTKLIKGIIKVPYSEVKWNQATKRFQTIQFQELASHQARISAIAELNKMEGDYAPTKVAPTDKDGNDLAPAKKQVIIINGQEIEF